VHSDSRKTYSQEVLCLSLKQFRALREKLPEIATKLLTNIALELGRLLRRTSNQVRLLESSLHESTIVNAMEAIVIVMPPMKINLRNKPSII
jgi:hypothetical protein